MVGSRVMPGRTPRGPAAPMLLAMSAVAGTAAAGVLILTRHPAWAGIAALVASGSLAAMSWRAGRHPTRSEGRGISRRAQAFARRVLERTFEAGVLVSIAWVARNDPGRVAALSLAGLGASYLGAYERAKARSLGYRGLESPGLFLVQSGVVALGLLSGWLEPLLWIFVLLAAAAATVRGYSVALQERRRRGSGSAATPGSPLRRPDAVG